MADVELYTLASSGQRRAAARVLDELWPHLDWTRPPGGWADSNLVLDVGCGSGETTLRELLPRLPNGVGVIAVDSSQDMLCKAKANTEDRISFWQLDIATPRLTDTAVWRLAPYSKVFSFFCLHWVRDQRMALRNIADLLQPGGDAVLVLVAGCPLFDLYEQFSMKPRWAPYMHDYKKFVSPYHNQEDPEKLLKAFLTESGLGVKSCHLDKDFSFSSSNQQEIIDSLWAVIPFPSRMPPAERESFFQELMRACYANGTLSVDRRQGAAGGDLHRWNFGLLVAHAAKEHDHRSPWRPFFM